MLHIFKLNGHRTAYDCATRTAYPLSSLAMKILDTVTPPLTPDCPSSLRYALAKYDSHDLADAYAEIYALYKAGLLFSETSAEAEMPAELYAVIESSAGAVKEKIESAAAAGFTKMIVTVKDGCPCLAASLSEAYGDKLDLRLILELTGDTLTGDDIETLNKAGCYARVSDIPAALKLADRGLRFLDAEIPATEAGLKEAGKLEKEIERRDGGFDFASFTLSMLPKEGFDLHKDACADCWARELCGGSCLGSSTERTALCDVQRTCLECAITLAGEKKE